MATKTRAEMISRVLTRLGVLAAGQTATDEDSDLAGEVLDSLHKSHTKRGLAPYATTAYPEWAQRSVVKIAAHELASDFGITGQRLAEFAQAAIGAERDLSEQVAAQSHAAPTRFKAY